MCFVYADEFGAGGIRSVLEWVQYCRKIHDIYIDMLPFAGGVERTIHSMRAEFTDMPEFSQRYFAHYTVAMELREIK